MKILLINDTINSKNLGCQLVSHMIRSELVKLDKDVEIHSILLGQSGKNINYSSYDYIYVNGEGSMSHGGSEKIFRDVSHCLAKNQNVFFCNFSFDPWPPLPRKINWKRIDQWLRLFDKCRVVAVREPLSYRFLQKCGFSKVKLFPDVGTSISDEIEPPREKQIMFGVGSALKYPSYNNHQTLQGFDHVIKHFSKNYKCLIMDWPSNPISDGAFLKSIRGDNIIHMSPDFREYHRICKQSLINVTGRHHGVVMSYSSLCPYMSFRSNMWKTEGDCFLYGNYGFFEAPPKKSSNLWIDKIEEQISNSQDNQKLLRKRRDKLKKYHNSQIRVINSPDMLDVIDNRDASINFDQIDEYLKRIENEPSRISR